MPKWNIDKLLLGLEKALGLEKTSGFAISRVLMDNTLLKSHGLVRDEVRQPDGQSTLVWSIGVGRIMEPKDFFYGYSIYAASQRARQVVKNTVGVAKKKVAPRSAKSKRVRVQT